ncbi:DUF6279 family lipoprotein [Roseateles violae]|uniref:DUF6279 family lipoprotein n=1 Tax=Roseateles violae TaxID=3058042 RepID=A0ABT8DV38_9BURK|nr:DUF6279 family lipoprotein [Pelomonas sp. PFR6]MDN3920159.1 DUF6279 family lipoprotein [Pelomonas sp. PFR6]
MLKRTVLILLAALLLQACSAVRLAYNNADSLLYWRLDNYLDFSSEQAPRVRAELRQYQQWHRREQLPRYAETLRRIAPQLQGPLAPEQACALTEQIRQGLEATLDPAHWPLAWLPAELSEGQLQQLERKQARSNEEWRHKWMDAGAAELAQQRFDAALSRIEWLYGGLSSAQQGVLHAALATASVFDAARSLAERQRRQQQLVLALRQIRAERLAPEAARARLRVYMQQQLLGSPEPAEQRYQEALLAEGCAVFARVHNATTPAQRAKAQRSLLGWAEDFRALAAQAN